MKRRRVDHIDVAGKMVFTRDEFAKRPTVSILHPAVGTDEPESSAGLQTPQASFHEWDVDIRPVVERGVPGSVLSQQNIRD